MASYLKPKPSIHTKILRFCPLCRILSLPLSSFPTNPWLFLKTQFLKTQSKSSLCVVLQQRNTLLQLPLLHFSDGGDSASSSFPLSSPQEKQELCGCPVKARQWKQELLLVWFYVNWFSSTPAGIKPRASSLQDKRPPVSHIPRDLRRLVLLFVLSQGLLVSSPDLPESRSITQAGLDSVPPARITDMSYQGWLKRLFGRQLL